MTFRPLEQAGLIEPYRVPLTEIEDLLGVARRDVKTARELVDIDLDWALIVAYNAALQAGLALMYANAYRPKGPDKHKTVIHFLRAILDPAFGPKLNRLDRIRKKRHRAVYHLAGAVSEGEAKVTLEFAEELVTEFVSLIKKEEE